MYVCILKIFYLGALQMYILQDAKDNCSKKVLDNLCLLMSQQLKVMLHIVTQTLVTQRKTSNNWLYEKLIHQKLPWRSEEFETVLRSLDRKLDRHRDPRSTAMCLTVQMGENSLHGKPEGSPDWANNLHHPSNIHDYSCIY